MPPRHLPGGSPVAAPYPTPPPLFTSATAGAACRKSGEQQGERRRGHRLLPRYPALFLSILSSPRSSFLLAPWTCSAARSALVEAGSARWLFRPSLHHPFWAGSGVGSLQPRRRRASPCPGCGGPPIERPRWRPTAWLLCRLPRRQRPQPRQSRRRMARRHGRCEGGGDTHGSGRLGGGMRHRGARLGRCNGDRGGGARGSARTAHAAAAHDVLVGHSGAR